jgi:hypothetical protein
LLGDAGVRADVRRALSGASLPGDGWTTVERAVSLLSAPWQLPELPVSVNPAWGASRSGSGCSATTGAVRRWLGPRS